MYFQLPWFLKRAVAEELKLQKSSCIHWGYNDVILYHHPIYTLRPIKNLSPHAGVCSICSIAFRNWKVFVTFRKKFMA